MTTLRDAKAAVEAMDGWRVFGVEDGQHFVIAGCVDASEALRIMRQREDDYPYARPLHYANDDSYSAAALLAALGETK